MSVKSIAGDSIQSSDNVLRFRFKGTRKARRLGLSALMFAAIFAGSWIESPIVRFFFL